MTARSDRSASFLEQHLSAGVWHADRFFSSVTFQVRHLGLRGGHTRPVEAKGRIGLPGPGLLSPENRALAAGLTPLVFLIMGAMCSCTATSPARPSRPCSTTARAA